MDARLAPVSDLPRYSFSQPPDQAQQVPILQWSSKSFVSRWSATAEATLQWDLTTRDGQFVRGTLTNPLDVKLSDCLLAFGRYAYAVGELEPGATISVGPNLLDTTELETQLTYKQVVRDEENPSTWNRPRPTTKAAWTPAASSARCCSTMPPEASATSACWAATKATSTSPTRSN